MLTCGCLTPLDAVEYKTAYVVRQTTVARLHARMITGCVEHPRASGRRVLPARRSSHQPVANHLVSRERYGKSNEVADAIAFLASDGAGLPPGGTFGWTVALRDRFDGHTRAL